MKKILAVHFKHETNVFCPAPADLEAFRVSSFAVGEEVFAKHRGVGTEMGGFLDALEGHPDFCLIPSVAMTANPSGPVTAEAYAFVEDRVKQTVAAHSPLDAVIIAFHGAMVAEGHPDGEGDMLELIRSLVGWKIPVMASLDLHANITEKMVRCATALLPYECYPHTDDRDTGYATGCLLADTLDGKVQPVMAYRRIPYLLPLFPSARPEIRPLYELAASLQAQPGSLCVRFAHGFFPSDIAEMGMSVLAIADGSRELAEAQAEELAAAIEAAIPRLKREYISLDEALDRALLPGEGPVVLADASDNPGGGGMGDTTHILRRILERGITGAALAIIVDPSSAKRCAKAGVGTKVELSLGGGSDPSYSGGPLQVTAYVRALTDGKYVRTGPMLHGTTANLGTTAVVEIAGNLVIIASLPKQPLDLQVFRAQGIVPEQQKILVTKSAVHYEASFGTVAREMIPVNLPGYAVPVPEGFELKNWTGK